MSSLFTTQQTSRTPFVLVSALDGLTFASSGNSGGTSDQGGMNGTPPPATIVFSATDSGGTTEAYRVKTDGTEFDHLTASANLDELATDGVHMPTVHQYAVLTTSGADPRAYHLNLLTGELRELIGDLPFAPGQTPQVRWNPNSSQFALEVGVDSTDPNRASTDTYLCATDSAFL